MLVPGYGVEATVNWDGEDVRVASIYVPPTRSLRDGVWEALGGALERGPGTPLYGGGDLNVQLGDPRAGEEELVGRITASLGRVGVATVQGPRVTHRGRAGDSAVDVVLAPVNVAWRCGAVAEWRRHLSDHAGLAAGLVAATPRDARTLTLATFNFGLLS